MSRVRTLAGSVILSGSILFSAGVAGAQTPTTQYPGSTVPTTTPTTTATTTAAVCSGPITSPDVLVANAVVDFTAGPCARFVAGRSYDGTGNSTPFALPATTATGQTVTFRNVKLPADFEVGATHRLVVKDAVTGVIALDGTFFVANNGQPAAKPTSGLPKTGSDLVDPALKVGGALLALGGTAVLVARRRKAEAGSIA